jgi:putative glutamine amidotransferase
MASARPLIGISADRRVVGYHHYHMVGEKYARALMDAAGAAPVVIPSLAEELQFEELIERLDGLLFTGSPSNVEPHHYQGRDATTLPLIRKAVAAGVPVFGICRGFQEMNVAFGGTLHQKLHEVPGNLDHRDDESLPLEVQYGPAHDVTLEPGGLLRSLASADSIRVNSLHNQGINRLGSALDVEARAPDGVIEAFRVHGSQRFALAVQWHPEWQVMQNPFSRAVFAAFGDSCRERAQSK